MSQLAYWIWLASCGLSPMKAARLAEELGSPTAVYFAGKGDLARVAELDEKDFKLLSEKSLSAAQGILDACEKRGVSVVTRQDAAYPARLNRTEDPPPVLYLKGRLPRFGLSPAVAVVGTRRPSAYGYYSAKKMGFQLAAGGAILVSGMAEGCDGAAMKGALLAGGGVVAVLGNGVDICYPESNRELYEDTCRYGAVISEYPPGTGVTRLAFPKRNRIISGLSDAVVVTEAPERSGALITAGWALEQGRDVYAIPTNIDNPTGQGGNSLIRQGAMLASSGADILEELAPRFDGIDLSAARRDPPRTNASGRALSESSGESAPRSAAAAAAGTELDMAPAERAVYEAVRENGSLGLDEIIAIVCEGGGFDEGAAASAVTMLELVGALRQLPGRIYGI